MLNVSEYKRKVDLENKDEELCKYEEFIKNEIRHGYNYILLSEDKNIGIGLTYHKSSPSLYLLYLLCTYLKYLFRRQQ